MVEEIVYKLVFVDIWYTTPLQKNIKKL